MAKAAAAPAADPVLLHAIRPADMTPTVEKWNPNPTFDRAESPERQELPPSSEDDKTPAETPGAKEPAKEPPTPVDTPPEEDKPPAAAAPVTPDRRQQIREAIEAQKKKLGLETAVTTERQKREAAEAELERLKKGSVHDLLRFRGLDPKEVEDQALIGGDMWRETPTAAAPVANLPPEVAERLKKADENDAWIQEQKRTTQQQAISNALGSIRDTLKAADVPALKVTPGGYQRVMAKAHEAWKATGESGSAWDYIADAAALVEEEVRKENPDLAALVESTKGAKPAAADEAEEEKPAAEPKPTRVVVGKKLGANPEAKAKPLPRDRDARDREIKKMFGWD